MFEIPDYNGIGVYAIINDTNGKVYVGSSINIASRFKQHNASIKTGNYNQKMLEDIHKGDSFHVEILEKIADGITRDELNKRERYYADKYNAFKSGYNSMNIPTIENRPYEYYKNRSDNRSKIIVEEYEQNYLAPLRAKPVKKIVTIRKYSLDEVNNHIKKRGYFNFTYYINHLIEEDMKK